MYRIKNIAFILAYQYFIIVLLQTMFNSKQIKTKMKKRSLLLSVVTIVSLAISLVGCKNNEYKISGSIEGLINGEQVTIMRRGSNFNMDTLGVSIVEKGKFTFSGKQDTTSIWTLVYNINGTTKTPLIFVEPGNIKVEINREKETILGSPSNDAYQELRTELKFVEDFREQLIGKMKEGKLKEDTEEYYDGTQKFAEMSKKADQKAFEVAKKNAKNEVGALLFGSFSEKFTAAQREELAELLSEENKKKEHVVPALKRMLAEKNTKEGNKFVDLEMKSPEGEVVKLSDLVSQNKLVVVDFWASWCGPCRAATPELINIYNEYKDKGVQFVGISLDTSLDEWKESIAELSIPWIQMSDLRGWSSAGAEEYVVRGVPHLMVISQDGTILKRGINKDELKEFLKETFK